MIVTYPIFKRMPSVCSNAKMPLMLGQAFAAQLTPAVHLCHMQSRAQAQDMNVKDLARMSPLQPCFCLIPYPSVSPNQQASQG